MHTYTHTHAHIHRHRVEEEDDRHAWPSKQESLEMTNSRNIIPLHQAWCQLEALWTLASWWIHMDHSNSHPTMLVMYTYTTLTQISEVMTPWSKVDMQL